MKHDLFRMASRVAILGTLAAFTLLLDGCGQDCVPGALAGCDCPDGTRGTQVCTTEHDYGECRCDGMDDAGMDMDAGEDVDSGMETDSGMTETDSGMTETDSGMTETDSGMSEVDGGPGPGDDGGPPDAGPPDDGGPPDAGPPEDGGPPDAGPPEDGGPPVTMDGGL